MKRTEAVIELRRLLLEESVNKYPTLPDHARPVNSFDSTKNKERRELKRIAKYIELKGGICSITDSSAKRIDKTMNYVDSVGFNRTIGSVEFRKNTDFEVGHSDLTATINGQAHYIELKRVYKSGKDRQSEAQKAFQSKVTKAGAIYLIVNSFEDFYNIKLI